MNVAFSRNVIFRVNAYLLGLYSKSNYLNINFWITRKCIFVGHKSIDVSVVVIKFLRGPLRGESLTAYKDNFVTR